MLSVHQSYTVYKIWCFYLYQVWRYKSLNIYLRVIYTHIHAQTNSQKLLLWTQGTSKQKSGENSASKILTEKNISITLRQQGNGSKKRFYFWLICMRICGEGEARGIIYTRIFLTYHLNSFYVRILRSFYVRVLYSFGIRILYRM